MTCKEAKRHKKLGNRVSVSDSLQSLSHHMEYKRPFIIDVHFFSAASGFSLSLTRQSCVLVSQIRVLPLKLGVGQTINSRKRIFDELNLLAALKESGRNCITNI